MLNAFRARKGTKVNDSDLIISKPRIYLLSNPPKQPVTSRDFNLIFVCLKFGNQVSNFLTKSGENDFVAFKDDVFFVLSV